MKPSRDLLWILLFLSLASAAAAFLRPTITPTIEHFQHSYSLHHRLRVCGISPGTTRADVELLFGVPELVYESETDKEYRLRYPDCVFWAYGDDCVSMPGEVNSVEGFEFEIDGQRFNPLSQREADVRREVDALLGSPNRSDEGEACYRDGYLFIKLHFEAQVYAGAELFTTNCPFHQPRD